ncbi:MAG: CpsD/CapB family tyrosine-protein kinase [Bacillota bacterium]|nr:CpsD/CapB family tyrosine-protein kinase [Bacillota bacterium]
MSQSRDYHRNLIVHHDPRSPVSEAFRTLRTNLEFLSPDRPVHSILVTSPGPSEGKSTVSANLAISLAQAGRQVILVDADMRKPVQHRLFSLPNATGLTTALVRGVMPDIYQDTLVRGLRVVTSGPIPPNPAELLGSGMMGALIGALASEADFVIYDAPPVVAVTDAILLAPKLDGVILAIRLGVTSRDAAKRTKQLLSGSRSRLLGVVLNQVRPGRGYGYYYYYYYYGSDPAPELSDEEAATAVNGKATSGR